MKLYYLHGFRSHYSTATKLNALREYYFKKTGVKPQGVRVKYNPHKPKETAKLMAELFANNKEECVIVGCSLGGFWANLVSVLYNKQVILINPSTDPASTIPVEDTFCFQNNELIHYNSDDQDLFKSFKKILEGYPESTSPVTCLLSLNDEVVDYRIAAEYFKNKKVIKIPVGGHQIPADIWEDCVDMYLGKELFWMAG